MAEIRTVLPVGPRLDTDFGEARRSRRRTRFAQTFCTRPDSLRISRRWTLRDVGRMLPALVLWRNRSRWRPCQEEFDINWIWSQTSGGAIPLVNETRQHYGLVHEGEHGIRAGSCGAQTNAYWGVPVFGDRDRISFASGQANDGWSSAMLNAVTVTWAPVGSDRNCTS